MDKCGNQHEDIVYDSDECPICAVDDQMDCLHSERLDIKKCSDHEGEPCWLDGQLPCPACALESERDDAQTSLADQDDLDSCSDGHQEIRFSSDEKCPMCALAETSNKRVAKAYTDGANSKAANAVKVEDTDGGDHGRSGPGMKWL